MEKENTLKDSIEPVNIKSATIILNQMMNCICKIKIKGRFGTGFFCKIPFRKKTIKVLMTNYHILNEKDLKDNKNLYLSLNDEKETLKIDLGLDRETYFNKEYNVTLIELRDEDNIKNYLELDNNLFQDNPEINYKDTSIYILHYPNCDTAAVSYGISNNIDKYNINHKCRINIGSSGSPILNLKNNKVIGIHNKSSNGTLLKFPLNNYINKREKMFININDKEFKIINEIGKGGFGRVMQVLSKSDNKSYAIKEIPIKGEPLENIKSYQNEAIILSKFNCENIVKYYDSSKDENNIYILMEYCNGKNLRNYIDENANNNTLIQENILYNIICQICTGIGEIHNKNIIHRDLNLKNIFMNDNMIIKIGDFGISKQFNSSYTLKTTKILGTEYYTAPEILIKGIYNKKSDIWSLGCIIYELFTLNIYYKDKFMNEIKKIDSSIYNNKWQILIDSLLEPDYKKRFDIYQVIKFLKEELNINYEHSIDKKENEINNININNKVNIIKGEIYINKDDINKDIRIINSFENVKRENKCVDEDDDWKYENEKEIKENIEIKINGKLIKFTYYYKFNKEGKYIIEYSFKNNLSKTCYMFYKCNNLININVTNFNTQNVTNMKSMFYECSSLKNLDLSNFNTLNVTHMSCMFSWCSSLTNIDLSNFNTQNVTDMSDMFNECSSLTNINLSNFNTQNVTNMRYMFYWCSSLTNIDLSNFNTQNVTDMSYMFSLCSSLKKQNVITNDKKILQKIYLLSKINYYSK